MQDGLLELSSHSDEEWALENLAGCDGKLFKIIARLSRLNILGQNASTSTSNAAYPDLCTQFGREWDDVRNALVSWKLDTSPFSSRDGVVSALTQNQQLDLLNISESFRFLALIYMERLALPKVQSSDHRIQTLLKNVTKLH